MKRYFTLCVLSLCLSQLFGQSHQADSTGRFGFTINSSFNGELYPIRIVPSITYSQGYNQFELGFGMHPFIQKNQKLFSGEFNHKYFPNGMDKKFNMYLLSRVAYVHNPRDTYFPTTYNYLFLNAGYGFEVSPFKNAFMGTNVSIGTFTYSKDSTVPYDGFAKKKMFDQFGFNLAFQFNVGYRF